MPYKDPEKRKLYEKNRKPRKRVYDAEKRKEYYASHPEKFAEYKKKYYEENRDQILEKKKQYHIDHQEERSEYNKQYHAENKDALNAYSRQYYQEHREELLAYDKERRPKAPPKPILTEEEIQARKEALKEYHLMYSKQWYLDNKEAVLQKHKEWKSENKARIRTQSRELRQGIKQEVIAHYGGRCSCCGQDDLDTLCIDHINDNGAEHRKTVTGDNMYRWIKDNNYPADLQVLCANCNYAKELVRRRQNLKPKNAALREYRKFKRSRVIQHYGGKCIHCGCEDHDLLCFDHVHGGGSKHRKEIKTHRLYEWLEKNSYPEGFQLLCFNCNLKKYVAIESITVQG
jgi:hypothetical protein